MARFSALPNHLEHYLAHQLPAMEGWCSADKARRMMESVRNNRPSMAVEVGVFAGRSLFAMGLAMQSIDFGAAIGVDAWSTSACSQGLEPEGEDYQWWTSAVDLQWIRQHAYDMRSNLGLTERVELLELDSQAAHAKFTAEMGSEPWIDLLHIDGNHSTEISTADVSNYVPMVRADGEVWFDDTDWASTADAQRLLFELCDPVFLEGSYGIFRRKNH